jgi:transcriptional regulator with XRE-family HTH domain
MTTKPSKLGLTNAVNNKIKRNTIKRMLEINTGELLKEYCTRKRIYKSGLARKTGIGYQSLLKHLKSKTLSVQTLLRLSEGLEHNFLMDIAVQLPKNFSTDAPVETTTEQTIATLTEKIKRLEAEKQALLEAISAMSK